MGSDTVSDVDKVSNIEINVQPASSLIRLPTENILNQEPSNTLIEDSLQMLDKLEANQDNQDISANDFNEIVEEIDEDDYFNEEFDVGLNSLQVGSDEIDEI